MTFNTDFDKMIITIEEYLAGIRYMAFTNYDGWGLPAKYDDNGELIVEDSIYLAPCNFGEDIPDGYTHVEWINR